MIWVKIKKLSNGAIVPTYGSEYSACMDLYADLTNCENNYVLIHPGETIKIGTGFAFEPPKGYCGLIYARSGLGAQGIAPGNCVGIADEDFRGEYVVALHNTSNLPHTIKHGDRIAQLMFVPVEQVRFQEVEDLSDTARGSDGFGSTGI